MGQLYLFGTKTQLEKLSNLDDPLTKANQLIDWKIFRKPIKTPHKKTKPKEDDHPTTPYSCTKLSCSNNGTANRTCKSNTK